MAIEQRNEYRCVQFDPALKVMMTAIDGTWARECLLVDASESSAQLAVNDPNLPTDEFFLLLSSVGVPAFRRCK